MPSMGKCRLRERERENKPGALPDRWCTGREGGGVDTP
jgi:hypothetical protein